MYKLNPLLESNNKQDKEFKKAALGLGSYGLLLGGIHGIKNSNLDQVTGVETRFHNAPKRVVDQILDQGILSKYATDPNNLTNRVLGDRLKKQDIKDLVYLAKNRSLANGSGATRYKIGIDSDKGKTLKVKIPYDEYLKLKRVENPELLGSKNSAEFMDRLPQHVKKHYSKSTIKDLYNTLSKGSDTIKGDISPEFIKGSKHFKKNMVRNNFLNYVKKHPGRFSKGIAGAGLSLSALGGGVYLGKKAYDLNK